MIDISVVILVGKEELHIRRCLECLAPLEPRQVFVVESQHGDRTHEIAIETAQRLGWSIRPEEQSLEDNIDENNSSTNLEPCDKTLILNKKPSNISSVLHLIWHDWPGLYAPQMNWAFENLPIASEWVMRLDADEYFLPEAIEEIKKKLPNLPPDVTGIIFKRRHYIFGGWAKHGTYPVKLLRIFRKGKGFCEERYMDEHIELYEGQAIEFDYDFVDHNLNTFEWWKEKHRGYAKREAMDAIEIMSEMHNRTNKKIMITGQAAIKRAKKYSYYRLPPYIRAFIYFFVRYFLKLGFLDGYTGWMWNFWQGLWYRGLVDREIGLIKKEIMKRNMN